MEGTVLWVDKQEIWALVSALTLNLSKTLGKSLTAICTMKLSLEVGTLDV